MKILDSKCVQYNFHTFKFENKWTFYFTTTLNDLMLIFRDAYQLINYSDCLILIICIFLHIPVCRCTSVLRIISKYHWLRVKYYIIVFWAGLRHFVRLSIQRRKRKIRKPQYYNCTCTICGWLLVWRLFSRVAV